MSNNKSREFAKGVYLRERETRIGPVTSIYLTKRFFDEVASQFADAKGGVALVAFKKEEPDDFGTHKVYIDSQERE